MVSSKPSRRICSISTPSCSSPRPATSNASVSFDVGDLDGDVALGLAEQPVADLARGDLLALAAGQRAVVDAEGHRQGRRIDRDGRQRRGQFRRADGVRDGGLGQAGDGDDVAGLGLLHRHAVQAAEGQQLGQPAGFHHVAVRTQHLHRHVQPGAALLDAAGQHAAEEVVVFQDARRPWRTARPGPPSAPARG